MVQDWDAQVILNSIAAAQLLQELFLDVITDFWDLEWRIGQLYRGVKLNALGKIPFWLDFNLMSSLAFAKERGKGDVMQNEL